MPSDRINIRVVGSLLNSRHDSGNGVHLRNMVKRILNPSKAQSYFLFGARGTGKTSLLEKLFALEPVPPAGILYVNLLDPDQEELLLKSPNRLKDMINEKNKILDYVIIDEIQKVPKLLDVIHYCIEKNKKMKFIMTGSSARKLKHGGANLLGGRAISHYLFPFTFLEAPNSNQLVEFLQWGGLPMHYQYTGKIEKIRFLKSYVQTYLKQEIQLEQLVRNIISFREFLDLAASSNTEIVNFSNIAKRSGVDEKTIARFYEILVDTLIGFFLEPYNKSIRERQSQKPKFYLFDTGIFRQLTNMADSKLVPGSSEFGKLFEQLIICECIRLNEYFETSYRFSYLRTKDGAEIDLIVQKPKSKVILIEIKSSSLITEDDEKHLNSLGNDIRHQEKWIICTEKISRKTENNVRILPWQVALKELFNIKI